MENESEKKENNLNEGETNSETEIDKISEGNEVGEVEIDQRVKDKKEQGVISGKKSSQDMFSDKTVTLSERRLEKQYGIDHGKKKHMAREEGSTSSESENCYSRIEKSEASFKVENHKYDNAQALNKISHDLNQPIQFKEGNTEVDNLAQFFGKLLYSYTTCALKNIKPAAKFSPSDIIYHSDISNAASLNKKQKITKILPMRVF